jgi:hypothetical protein
MKVEKGLIKKLYEEYKKGYLNELYDTPLKFKREDNNKYEVFFEDNQPIAYFRFSFMYNIGDSPIDYRKYNLDKYWDISWYWSSGIDNKLKNSNNFIKITSTSFKIVDDFIRNNNHPVLLGFGGLSEQHERIYSNKTFIDRWEVLFGEKYYVEWKNDKLWIINKNFHKIDESRLLKHSIHQQKPISEIYRNLKYPNKNNYKGILRNNLIKEQIKRIILKSIYLRS